MVGGVSGSNLDVVDALVSVMVCLLMMIMLTMSN